MYLNRLLAVDYVAWLYCSVDEEKSEFACLYPKLFTFETVKYRKNILVLSSNAVYINRSSVSTDFSLLSVLQRQLKSECHLNFTSHKHR